MRYTRFIFGIVGMIQLILMLIMLLTLGCVGMMWIRFRRQPVVVWSFSYQVKLALTGLIAFIADTVGVGSFAVGVAMAKLFNTFQDEQLPAINNGAQVIPGALSAFFFLKWVSVDVLTLWVLVIGTCIGGVLGGHMVSRLSQQKIRAIMILSFLGIILLLLAKVFGLMTLKGDVTALRGVPLSLGFIGVFICGGLTSAGVGLFAMIQGVLFLLNVSPVLAFPIMMTAGALQQPLTTMIFLKNDRIPIRETWMISFFGCFGVMIALPIVTHLSSDTLHGLLLLILVYNVFTIGRAFFSVRRRYARQWSMRVT
jgi:uncharacterized membrane protein YfcA